MIEDGTVLLLPHTLIIITQSWLTATGSNSHIHLPNLWWQESKSGDYSQDAGPSSCCGKATPHVRGVLNRDPRYESVSIRIPWAASKLFVCGRLF